MTMKTLVGHVQTTTISRLVRKYKDDARYKEFSGAKVIVLGSQEALLPVHGVVAHPGEDKEELLKTWAAAGTEIEVEVSRQWVRERGGHSELAYEVSMWPIFKRKRQELLPQLTAQLQSAPIGVYMPAKLLRVVYHNDRPRYGFVDFGFGSGFDGLEGFLHVDEVNGLRPADREARLARLDAIAKGTISAESTEDELRVCIANHEVNDNGEPRVRLSEKLLTQIEEYRAAGLDSPLDIQTHLQNAGKQSSD